ncbi:MAG: lysostaphin resistance A-like protein [Planctomycetaceae bacterium]
MSRQTTSVHSRVFTAPGPGLPEALLWSSGCHLVQLLVFLLLATGLLWCAAPVFPPSFAEVVRIIDTLGWETSFLFTGATSLAALLVIVPLVRWRIGPAMRTELGLRSLSAPQAILILGAVAPLALVSDQIYRWGLTLNDSLTRIVPELAWLTQFDVMQIVRQQAESTTFPVLLVALALAPAISEELVFRGLIGRGLTARWGVRTGVLLTTLIFAASHGTPAHALATVPVGLGLHAVYRMTGSLWGSILMHAGNNALAVTLMKLSGQATQPVSPALLYAALGYLLVVLTLLAESSRPGHRTAGDSGHWVPTPNGSMLSIATGRAFPLLAGCSIVTYTCVMVWSHF